MAVAFLSAAPAQAACTVPPLPLGEQTNLLEGRNMASVTFQLQQPE